MVARLLASRSVLSPVPRILPCLRVAVCSESGRPSDFFRRNVVLSFQEDAIGIRLRDVIGVDNMMWGSDYPHSESTFPRSRQILSEILAGVPEADQAKIAAVNTARVYNFDAAGLAASS